MKKLVHIIRAGKCISELSITLADNSSDQDYIAAAREMAVSDLKLPLEDFAKLLFDVVPDVPARQERTPFRS